jgi:MFS superfamily sulfate permease-like transporter
MPLLDVSEILSDPDFADVVAVTRSAETVDSHGRAQAATQTFANITAVVTAGQGDALKYLPEGAHIEGAILVHTTFRLVSESDTTQPDTVTWQGRDYVVTMLNDWSTFGAGFMIGVCTLKNLAGAAP